MNAKALKGTNWRTDLCCGERAAGLPLDTLLMEAAINQHAVASLIQNTALFCRDCQLAQVQCARFRAGGRLDAG